MTKINGRPAFPPSSLGENNVKAWARAEEQFFNVRAACLLHPAPFVDGYEDRSLNAAARDHLRPFLERGVKELAETRLGLL